MTGIKAIQPPFTWSASTFNRYEVRDYRSDEPTIGEPRNDDRLRIKIDADVPLSSRLSWQLYYSYGDYVSNLPRADFTQTIVGTRLRWQW